MAKLYFYDETDMSQPPVNIDISRLNYYGGDNSEIWYGVSYFGYGLDILIEGNYLQRNSAIVKNITSYYFGEVYSIFEGFKLSYSQLESKLEDGIIGLTFGSDKIVGSRFNDVLLGGRGDDEIFGARGNDSIKGGSGSDFIDGGWGKDTAVFGAKDNRVDLRITSRQATGEGRDKLLSVENINAGGGKDLIIGNGKNNTLIGGGGADRLNGKGGNDLLIGGGGGVDQLWGEKGRDTFQVAWGTGYTVIKDFRDGADRIKLGSGTSGIEITSRNGHAFVYQNDDLIARVVDAAGDLERSGQFLI